MYIVLHFSQYIIVYLTHWKIKMENISLFNSKAKIPIALVSSLCRDRVHQSIMFHPEFIQLND